MKQIQYGIQLFSLRTLAKEDLESAIRCAAKQGYHFIEFAGFHEHSAEEVKGWLDAYGVEVIGAHSGLAGLSDEKIDETIAYMHAIGCKKHVIAWMDIASREILDANIERINIALPKLKAAGISLVYHNHSQEFIRTDYGAMVHEELQAKTSLEFELDTCWLHFVGLDPVSVMRELRDRVHLIHLRDGVPARFREDGTSLELALGEGNTPIPEIRRAAMEMGMTMIVESAGQKPTGLQETKRCIDYLHTLD